MPRTARTGTLKRLTGANFRLSAADRSFLEDLIKVRVISVDDADQHHYQGQKSGARRRLDKLVDAGLLKTHDFTVPGSGAQRAYSFSSPDYSWPLWRQDAQHFPDAQRLP